MSDLAVNSLTFVRGAVVLQLQRDGQRGDPLLYEVCVIPDGFSLTRLDDGQTYTLRRGEDGWSCTCPHYVFRARKLGQRCKHISALADHQLI